MAKLDDLIAQVADNKLRAQLEEAGAQLRRHKKFGLVFEEHIPETALLADAGIRKGNVVMIRSEPGNKTRYVVDSLLGDKASISHGNEAWSIPIEDLLVVKPFGEPVYPVLHLADTVVQSKTRPFHSVINAENFYALQLLLFAYRGTVDCIYIDPPYNSGARDWKYNNDYVEEDDGYRHSKWLAFMERRLLLAKKLLNPERSVLLVTIDENEVHRLGLLIQQLFPTQHTQMITTVINPKGASLGRDFARVEEYIFVVYIGSEGIRAEVRDMLDEKKNERADRTVKWSSLIRGGAQGIRTDSPGAYFPVFVSTSSLKIHSFGEALPWESLKEDVPTPPGTIAVWPPQHPSGVEGRWGIGPEKARELFNIGALRLGRVDLANQRFPLSYLSSGIVEKIGDEITLTGRTKDGVMIVEYPENVKTTQPKTVWKMPSHNAGEYGSKMISQLLPRRKFPFPKSLYAVEDVLRFFLSDKPDALVLDFFAGSGTTTHAIARLNRRDGGQRRSIMVTNNEVSSAEAARLRKQGLRPGDPEWEALGICKHITTPRIIAAFTGKTPEGEPIDGDYKFTDEFPMSDGFEENVAFFDVTYEDPDAIEVGKRFNYILPQLWMAAGSVVDPTSLHVEPEWLLQEGVPFAVLLGEDHFKDFAQQVRGRPDVIHIWLVTDSPSAFARMRDRLPLNRKVGMLYRDYLRNFRVNVDGDATGEAP